MQLRIKTDISAENEPVTLAVAKNYIKYDGSDANEEALITSMTKSARELCEKHTGLTFAEKELYFFADPEDLDDRKRVTLPGVPNISVDNVFSIDDEGVEVELELNTGYYLYGMTEIEIYLPNVILTGIDVTSRLQYRAQYKAGYGHVTDTETLPEVLKTAILKQVAEWYENRENWIPVLSSEVKEILDAYIENTWLG